MFVKIVRTAFVLVAALSVLAACDVQVTTQPPHVGPKVLMLGDSNLALAGSQILSTYRPTHTARIDAYVGVQASDWTFWNARLPADQVVMPTPDVVVVQLGQNDQKIQTLAGLAAWRDAVDQHVSRYTVPVLWSEIVEIDGLDPAWTNSYNAILFDAVTRHPNLRIIDFPTAMEPYLTDQHLNTSQARQAYATWTLQQVNLALASA